MRQHVLDANALTKFLLNTPGHDVVAQVLQESAQHRTPVLMSAVNWGEVWYGLAKQIGISETERLLSGLPEKLGVVVIPADADVAARAARFKNKFQMPCADAFAAELAGTQNVLVTADVKAFQRVPKIRLLKLPPKKPN
jgi:predicted nucleic acid-binding protein